jgi:hypothetical protein
MIINLLDLKEHNLKKKDVIKFWLKEKNKNQKIQMFKSI